MPAVKPGENYTPVQGVTVEWLQEKGAFENSGEWVIPLGLCGRTVQLRFQIDGSGAVNEWSLLPSTGAGRVWLPTAVDTESGRRFVRRERVLNLIDALGCRIGS